ncbi:MAG: hypothetical protein NTY19_29170 [Planctomycetota bacterium]|nr:hypothetical protein [Planctomycetota bacterium]
MIGVNGREFDPEACRHLAACRCLRKALESTASLRLSRLCGAFIGRLPAGDGTNREGMSQSMSLTLNKPKLDDLANESWKLAEWLRGKFMAYEG